MVSTRPLLTAALFLVPALGIAQQSTGGPVILPMPPTPQILDPSTLTAAYQSMVGQWLGVVSPYAYELFGALALLEFSIFGWKLWMNGGDVRAAIMMTANKLLAISMFLVLLINGSTWMAAIINSFIEVGKEASGVPSLGPSEMLLQGFKIFGTLLWQATKNGLMLDFGTAIALILASVVICIAFLALTVQFMMAQIQVYLALGMGYFFLGFGGSSWTSNYVERYFAYSVSAGIRLMVIYMLAGAGWVVTNGWVAAAGAAPFSAAGVETAWAIMCGAVLYALIVWNGASIAAQILGGAPNLGHGDLVGFVAPAISAAVTAGMIGAGVMTGGAATAAGAAGAAAGAAGKAASGAGAGMAGAAASGATPPQTSPGGGSASSGMAAAGRAAGAMAQAGASALSRMPHGGAGSSAPTFNGFHH